MPTHAIRFLFSPLLESTTLLYDSLVHGRHVTSLLDISRIWSARWLCSQTRCNGCHIRLGSIYPANKTNEFTIHYPRNSHYIPSKLSSSLSFLDDSSRHISLVLCRSQTHLSGHCYSWFLSRQSHCQPELYLDRNTRVVVATLINNHCSFHRRLI